MVALLFATLIVADPVGAAIAAEKVAALQIAVDDAEDRWRAAALSSFSYRLVVGGPFGYTTYVISIDSNECKAKSRATFGKHLMRRKLDRCENLSMANLFAEFRRQLSYAQERIELSFDADYGYPIKASFQPQGTDDQSEYFEISAFKPRASAAANKSLEQTRNR